MHRRLFVFTLLILAFMVACGPSEAEIAAMTAAAATDTPVPTPTPTLTPTPTNTPTPTPIPYDLVVSVTDAEGSPIAAASVALPESGDDQPVQTDDAGQASWANLPGESITLNVSAQGYLPAEESATIERGPNEVTVVLERDPFGLLPSEACRENEALLYIEDFQDGEAQGWPEIQFNAPGWHLDADPDPERADNLLIYAQSAPLPGQPVSSTLQTENNQFDNAVWRIRFMMVGRVEESFNWRQNTQPLQVEGQEVFDSRYQIILGTNYNEGIRRLQQPLTNVGVGFGYRYPQQNTWSTLEISTFEGNTQVFMDGLLVMAYQDETPVPPGSIGLEYWPPDEASAVYFDNISVCGLSAPFESIFTEEGAE
jgi:hypothetical protein